MKNTNYQLSYNYKRWHPGVTLSGKRWHFCLKGDNVQKLDDFFLQRVNFFQNSSSTLLLLPITGTIPKTKLDTLQATAPKSIGHSVAAKKIPALSHTHKKNKLNLQETTDRIHLS